MKDKTDIFEPLHSKAIYDPSNPKLMVKQWKCIRRLQRFNRTRSSYFGLGLRMFLMKRMFAEVGKQCYIEAPFYANFGGKHVHLGDYVYANFGLTLVDDTHIYIGSYTMIAPNVTIATASHPISPTLRKNLFQYNLPVHIGNCVWIGANAVILPGVTIGDNSIIGAGSVVTKDIPSNVIAVGNPCRVLREITKDDDMEYNRGVDIPSEIIEKYINSDKD